MHAELLVESDPSLDAVLHLECLESLCKEILKHGLFQPFGLIDGGAVVFHLLSDFLIDDMWQLTVVADKDNSLSLCHRNHEVARRYARGFVNNHVVIDESR